MQSIAEVEAICERNMLAQAEAWQNKDDEEPSARECFDNCIHASACYRIYYEGGPEPEDREVALAEFLEVGKCGDECQEYEDVYCPMPWSGTMRCQGAAEGEGRERNRRHYHEHREHINMRKAYVKLYAAKEES